MPRIVRRVRGALRAEWRCLALVAWRQLRERGLLGVRLALAASLAMICLHELQQFPASDRVVRLVGEVRADQPLWVSLLRTPVSVLVPTRDQPVWGGLPRLVLSLGLAQLLLGPRRALLVGYGATLAGTLGARVMVAIGPDHFAGVPTAYAHDVDTGASAAVVGLFTCLSVRLRAPVLCLAFVVPTVVGSVLEPNLAGREHLVAVACVAACAVFQERRRPGEFRKPGLPAPSGPPEAPGPPGPLRSSRGPTRPTARG
ncbi:hypothetical protein GPA10_17395 [Streptomyces sp. p1417]|uniref:Uncharacterized protein n=1 Tax=Streptomyces typhae TaxID=2681492 RepID=A0A6L6WYE2_9ACTN|nr:hypothetical protein [Streptomyces typhae]MVO86487.1 hypothetical protein [Streptomyces typhae]